MDFLTFPTTHHWIRARIDISFELQSQSILFADNSVYYYFHRMTDFATFPTTHQWIRARIEKSKSFCPAVVVVCLDISPQYLIIKRHK